MHVHRFFTRADQTGHGSAFGALLATITIALTASVPALAQGPAGGLPPQAAVQAEVVVEGELDVVYEDQANGSRLIHFLRVAERRLRLQFNDDLPPGLATGSRVRARGRLQNDTLELSQGGRSVETVALATPNSFGEQRTLVMLVNFQDNTSQPYSVASAYATTFQTTSDFFRENSYQQTWLTGDVVGWITLPMTSGTCDYYRISSLAEEAATSQGINLGQYTRRIFAFPQIGACSWWGMGNVGGNPSRSWVNGSYALKVVAHELGHNFGDYHSKAASCDSAGCSTSEYGDTHDIMGSPTGHMNAFQKERVGWLNYGASPSVQTVSTSGSYWIDTMATLGAAPKALRILKSMDGSGYRTWYYVETRARTGFDGDLAPGVIVHTGSESTGNSSLQVDMTPLAAGFDSVLDVGQTFTDPAIGLTITTTGLNGSGASVLVDYPGAPCTMRTPDVSLSPGTSTLSGPSATLTLALRNTDDSSCAPADFLVNASVPAGWSVVTGVQNLVVAPGATASTTLQIQPATGASGSSIITGRFDRRNSSGPSGSASATVIVATDLSVTLTISSGKGGGYQFATSVMAGGTPVSGTTATFTITSPDGAVTTLSAVTNGSGTAAVNWKPQRRAARGTYQVRVTATSGSLTGTAQGAFAY